MPGDGTAEDDAVGHVDTDRLAFDLRRELRGEVRFDPGSRHLYSADASNFRQVPLGVVTPRDPDDLIAAVEICRRHDAPITHRGGGTSIAGQAVNVAVVIDGSRHLDRILDVDVTARRATVEPGVVLDDLERALAPHGLTFGPDPATRNRCTLGGMIGNNACGVHAQTYGRTDQNVLSLDVLRYRGHRLTASRLTAGELTAALDRDDADARLLARLVDLRDRRGALVRERFPALPRRVSGYNLDALTLDDGGMDLARALVGSEGTLATIVTATLRLQRAWPHRALVVFGHADVAAAGDHAAVLRDNSDAVALEGLDDRIVGHARATGRRGGALEGLPDGAGWLLAEFVGETRGEAVAAARNAALWFGGDAVGARVYDDADAARAIWTIREEGVGASSRAGGTARWPGWEDAAVPPEVLGGYLRSFGALLDDHGLDGSIYGHFGDGCVHARIGFDLETDAGVAAYRAFLEEAADLVVAHGGSLSGEHGDGQQRGELLTRMFGPEVVRAFEEFAAVWDPDHRMNPGKIVHPRRLDRDLRLAHAADRWKPEGRFDYPDDAGAFHRAQLRCVGVGTCRRDDGAGTMCPSYMVTHEERHSTRGRARLLFELLQPDSELDGWRDEHVREALDLCLSCKGCTAECPVGVDIPTAKAEFFHEHYAGRLRPRAHYALGLIRWWCRPASLAPGLVNAALAAPVLGPVLRRVAGVSTQRAAPAFATRTFRSWFASRPSGASEGGATTRRVVLFPDTFTDFFEPQIGQAAVEILEAAGVEVTLPDRPVCCGRPYYGHGFLTLAERALDRLLDTLTPDVERGARIVGLEPSCLAVFRDELVRLRPDDPRSRRLADATRTLAEYLVEIEATLPTVGGRAIVHGHCHHKASLGMDADGRIYDAVGLDWRELDAGCCGLAGSFGFEAGAHDEVADRAGRRKLAPAVEQADDDVLVLADGFSCRTQIAHLQDRRRALHLAEALRLAADDANGSTPAAAPDDSATNRPEADAPRADTAFGRRDIAATAAVALAVAGVVRRRRRRRMRG